MVQKDNSKTTVLFTNEALNDAINFKGIIPRMLIAYQRENLNEYYKYARMFLNHNQHLIIKESNKDTIKALRDKLNEVQTVLFKEKPHVKQKQISFAKERAAAFEKIEMVVLYIYQELHRIGYFKKSVTSSGDIMDEYFKHE